MVVGGLYGETIRNVSAAWNTVQRRIIAKQTNSFISLFGKTAQLRSEHLSR